MTAGQAATPVEGNAKSAPQTTDSKMLGEKMSKRYPIQMTHSATALAIALCWIAMLPMHAQSTTFARLIGTVTDQSGSVIPGVEITVLNKATNVSQKTLADDSGNYVVDKLPPGVYDVSAELPGFKTNVAVDVRLVVGQTGRVDLLLMTGEISEKVTVTGQSPIIDTATAEVASIIDEKTIKDLPLAGRVVTKLAYLTTGGIQADQSLQNVDKAYNYGGGLPAFNGLATTSNQVLLDGANNLGMINQDMAYNPAPETVQEFKIITNNYSAEFGRAAGAVVQIVTKSGTNQFHGDAWLYLRDERFDANNFFANRARLGKLPVDKKLFGGAFGGPIFKNRTFFYGHYDRHMEDTSQPGFITVPTAAQLRGDFSKADGPFDRTRTAPLQLYDPLNVVDGQRVPFPNNQIPESRINPIAKKLLQALPPPAANQPDFPNYAFPLDRSLRRNKYSIRVDHHFVGEQTLFGRFSFQKSPELFTRPPGVGVPGMPYGIYQSLADINHGWQSAAGWVKPFGSTIVTELNASAWRFQHEMRNLEYANYLKELGYDIADRVPEVAPDGKKGPAGIPSVRVDGYNRWEGVGTEELSDWGFNVKQTVSWKRGDHYLKFGFEHMRNLDVKNRWVPEGSARNDFDGFATGQIIRNAQGGITGSTFGDPWADFLLGTSSAASGNVLGGGGFGTGGIGQFSVASYSAFINDDWSVSRNVTLNLGLRWDVPLPPVYLYDRVACYVDGSQGRDNPRLVVPKGLDLKADFISGGDLANLPVPFVHLDDRRCYPARYDQFAPRLGLAWRMFGTNRTVLRFAAGLTYEQFPFGANMVQAGYLGTFAGIVNEVQGRGQAPRIFLGQFTTLPQAARRQDLPLNLTYEPNFQSGEIYSYNVSFQHELLRATKVEVAYVGNQGRHVYNSRRWNVALPEGYTGILQTGEKVVLTGSQLQRRPYPKIAPHHLAHSDGSNAYNSFQAKLERRFEAGLALSAGWTWSKAMSLNYEGTYQDHSGNRNEFERHLNKSVADWDRTQSFYTSLVWELPFFNHSAGFARTLLGGWEITNVTTLASGRPFGIEIRRDLWNQGGSRRPQPNRIADGGLPENKRTVERFFDPSAFEWRPCSQAQVPGCLATGSLGNSAYRPLRSDGLAVFDFSFHKAFALGEEKKFTFRVDMFNAFNHPIFYFPAAQTSQRTFIDDPQPARVTNAAAARQIQLGFRFSF